MLDDAKVLKIMIEGLIQRNPSLEKEYQEELIRLSSRIEVLNEIYSLNFKN